RKAASQSRRFQASITSLTMSTFVCDIRRGHRMRGPEVGETPFMSTLASYDLADGIATIAMDDGKVNALSTDMLAQVSAHFDQAEADEAVVILTGRERTLSAGVELSTEPEGWPEMLVAGARLAERMLSFPRPVVVACNGNAIAM